MSEKLKGAKLALGIRRSTGDLFTYPTILGMIVGRVGCFLGGLADCTFGNVTESWVGIDFGDGMARHPTQLYETTSMVLLVFLLLSYYPFKKRDGSVMVLLMVCYGVHRFLNEMLRIDNRLQFDGLTFSQNVSILVLLAAAVLAYFVFRRRPATEPAPALPAAKSW